MAALMVGTRARTEDQIRINLAQVGTLDNEIDEMISRYYDSVPEAGRA